MCNSWRKSFFFGCAAHKHLAERRINTGGFSVACLLYLCLLLLTFRTIVSCPSTSFTWAARNVSESDLNVSVVTDTADGFDWVGGWTRVVHVGTNVIWKRLIRYTWKSCSVFSKKTLYNVVIAALCISTSVKPTHRLGVFCLWQLLTVQQVYESTCIVNTAKSTASAKKTFYLLLSPQWPNCIAKRLSMHLRSNVR